MSLESVARESETVSVLQNHHAEYVTTVVLDRPDARNAMNEQLRTELKAVLDALPETDTRAVVLTGSDGSSTFVSGADVKDLRERDVLDQRAKSERKRVYDHVEALPMPVIARINGHAMGGGLELALACDVRIVSDDAMIGFPEVTLGLIPGGGGTQRLPRLVGQGQAMRLILSGEVIDATEAAAVGIVEDVVPADELDDAVYSLAGKMASRSPVALELAKKAVQQSANLPLERGIDYESQLFVQLFASADKDEGIDAFLEDREPEWPGR